MEKLKWRQRACSVFLLCAATAVALPAQDSDSVPVFTTLHTFDSTDGGNPSSALIQASDGNLYGTTPHAALNDGGTVFKISPGGTLTTLYSFCPLYPCADGYQPFAGLIQATDGNFYGATFGGGSGDGTLFKLTSDGTLTTLFDFSCRLVNCKDGLSPTAALLEGADGNLYGTAPYDSKFGYGTVFKATSSGRLTTLYTFCPGRRNCADGASPDAPLIQATDGTFYGTTYGGGASGRGTIFKITSSGMLTTLYSFCSQPNCADGLQPYGLVQATDGNLYGTTSGGGANIGDCFQVSSGCGTIFKITPSGTLTTLYNFCPLEGCRDGSTPVAPLVQATDGNFYGLTAYGGTHESGTVFRMTPTGTVTTLYSFCSQSGCPDGQVPFAGLTQATDGNFYGMTYYGGDTSVCFLGYGCGTVFSLSVGLGPFVETQPTSGKVGLGVRILGTNLTGATSVTFSGTAAVFHVASSSLITATVPVGATTGEIQVVTPSGTLSSNVPFRVKP